jgi:hypothetical protein
MPLMRHSKFLLILFLFFLCFSKSKTNSNIINDTPPVDNVVLTESLDSLDVDSSSFIVTNFPDSIKEVIYKTNHRLFDYVLQSYLPDKNEDTVFSVQKLKELTLADGFKIDTSTNKVTLWKPTFNKRQQIEYTKNKNEIKILIGSQLWSDGKKYQLLWISLLPDKKDETVVDNF